MTDTTPTPKRAPAAKTAAAKAPAAKAPAAKAPAAKAPAARTTAAKTTPAVKSPATAKTTPAKTTAVKTTTAKAPAAKTTVTPVEATPAAVAIPAAATAPAGWYPVAGTTQQRWWDGSQWTEHVYGAATPTAVPAAAAAQAAVPAGTAHHHETLKAPAGVKPGTAWFWLMAVGAPVLTILQLIPTSIYLNQVIGGDSADPSVAAANIANPGYILVALSGWFIDAVCIVFALLDWRDLKARGIPKPFHWAWSFFVLLLGWPAVYVIGRTVIVKHRTGSGLAPLWVFIGLQIVAFIVGLVVAISAALQFFTLFGDLLSTAGNVL